MYTTLFLKLSIYGYFICSAVASTKCLSSPPYSVNGSHQDCCTVDGTTCGVTCELKIILYNTTVHITFPCFNLTNITLNPEVLSANASVVLVENVTLTQSSETTSQDMLALNRTFVCVTSLQLAFAADDILSNVHKLFLEFSTDTCSTATALATTAEESKPTQSTCSDCTGEPNTQTLSDKASNSPSMATTDTTTSEVAGSTIPPGEELTTGSPAGSAITTAIISATGTLASILLLVAVAIIVLTLVLVTRRKKMLFARNTQNDTDGNNYVTVGTRRDPPPLEAGPHFPQSSMANLATDEHALTEIHPQGWDAYPSLPRPQADPGFATIEEWVKAKENMTPVTNLNYASSISINSNSIMSEPPDYESIQDVQRKYFFPSEGVPGSLDHSTKLRTRSLQDFRMTSGDNFRAATTVDRIRNRQDRATKMAQVLEEEASPRSKGLTGSPLTKALVAKSFPYGDATAGAKGIGCTEDAMSREHSVDNDLYEATSRRGGDPDYLVVVGENFYENSDLGPQGAIAMCAQALGTEVSTVASPPLSTSPTYTTMSSIAPTLPLGGGAQDLQDAGSWWGTALEQDKVPQYSKVKKVRKRMRRNSGPCEGDSDDEAPPIPPYCAALCTGTHEEAEQAPNHDVGAGERKCYPNT